MPGTAITWPSPKRKHRPWTRLRGKTAQASRITGLLPHVFLQAWDGLVISAPRTCYTAYDPGHRETTMPRCLTALLPLLLAGLPAAASGAPLRFQCDSTLKRGGEYTRRLTTLDLDHGTVADGRLVWRDGGASPSLVTGHLIAYVRQAGQRVEWGSRNTRTGEDVSSFSLDLASGAYVFASGGETLARGRCRMLPDSI